MVVIVLLQAGQMVICEIVLNIIKIILEKETSLRHPVGTPELMSTSPSHDSVCETLPLKKLPGSQLESGHRFQQGLTDLHTNMILM